MVNVVLEFDYSISSDTKKHKACRFTICNQSHSLINLANGDEIGFDLIESKEFFYATVSRKVYVIGHAEPVFIICIPNCFNTAEEAMTVLDKFKAQFGDDLAVDH